MTELSQITEIKSELTDRYGKLPETAANTLARDHACRGDGSDLSELRSRCLRLLTVLLTSSSEVVRRELPHEGVPRAARARRSGTFLDLHV